MTNKEINMAIAEACGWKFVDAMAIRSDGLRMRSAINNPRAEFCPDYANDLNAMREAEILMDPYTRLEIARRLRYDVFATASQRAEAFLRTLGKWDEK